MFELIVAIAWWPLLFAAAILIVIVGFMILDTFLDKVWGKQPKGQKWSRK